MLNVANVQGTSGKNGNYNPFSDGTSTITLGKSTVSVTPGTSATDSYTVNLASGSTWGTSLSSNSLSGFTISFSNSGGDPPYTGTMTVSVASSVSDGTYHIYVNATGDDPSSSPAVLSVSVTGHASSTTPPPVTPSKSFTALYGADIAGTSVIILFLLAALVPMALRRKNLKVLGYVSFIVSMGSAIFLITDDSLLRTSGYLHWILLIIFTAGMIVSMLGFLLTKDKLKETARMGLAYGSIFMSIAMILDAALGLPLSSIANVGGPLGFNYLFGFGITSPSTVAVSLAFSILLIFNGLLFSSFVRSKNARSVKSSR
ncbi:MAG: hypothetical protein B2I18_03745 [Cuniculiplasma sp. C_DKE]|nr:MAG: hypothetical protein B2I18_03745 [Cuniculiplasma sp. C_DKE]